MIRSPDMTRNHATATVDVPVPHRRGRGLRPNAFVVVLLLLLQYGLGMWVNLFATIPASDQHKGTFAAFGAAVAHGPAALTLHALLGTLLLATAIALVIRAALTRTAVATSLSGAGLLAIIAAWFAGTRFVGTGASGPSFGMAMAAAVALLCYVTILVRRDSAATRG